ASNPHPLGDPSNAPLTAINTMIYIGNIEILTAKSAIYLGNVGQILSYIALARKKMSWFKMYQYISVTNVSVSIRDSLWLCEDQYERRIMLTIVADKS
ncbi:hypothetical protein, partial [Sphingomonas koreensis]|uniref:hypothetical protein n=1 Tax=Sphingomonas koreensis TaxID=93064 RepID=UPI0019CFAB56